MNRSVLATLTLVSAAFPLLSNSLPTTADSASAELPFAAAESISVCDGFGKEWVLQFDEDPGIERGLAVSGFRDLDGQLCGVPFPVFGTLVGDVLTVTTFDFIEDTCISVAWRGTVIDGQINGEWQNEQQSNGGFVLAPCESAATEPTEFDPARAQ